MAENSRDELSLEVVSAETEPWDNLLQLECRVRVGDWSGVTTAYTVTDAVWAFSDVADKVARSSLPQGEFAAGDDAGNGMIRLRLYPIPQSEHIGCEVQLAAETDTDHRAEEVWRLTVEMRTEAGFIQRFAQEVWDLATNRHGRAVLPGVPRFPERSQT